MLLNHQWFEVFNNTQWSNSTSWKTDFYTWAVRERERLHTTVQLYRIPILPMRQYKSVLWVYVMLACMHVICASPRGTKGLWSKRKRIFSYSKSSNHLYCFPMEPTENFVRAQLEEWGLTFENNFIFKLSNSTPCVNKPSTNVKWSLVLHCSYMYSTVCSRSSHCCVIRLMSIGRIQLCSFRIIYHGPAYHHTTQPHTNELYSMNSRKWSNSKSVTSKA